MMITEKTMSDLVGLVEEALDERTYRLFEDRMESANYTDECRTAFAAMRTRIRQALPVVERFPLLLEAANAAFAALNSESMEYRAAGDSARADHLDDVVSALAEALQACGIQRPPVPPHRGGQ
jgi:hypothetical protein